MHLLPQLLPTPAATTATPARGRRIVRELTRPSLLGVALLLLGMLAAAATPAQAARPHKKAWKAGVEAADRGDWDWAVVYFQRAVDLKPADHEYRTALEQARVQASYVHFEFAKKHLIAGNLEAAITELQQTVTLNPAHQYAYVELEKALEEWKARRLAKDEEAQALQRMKREADRKVGEIPRLDPKSNIPIQFALEDKTLEEVFQVIQDVSNINVIFDEGVRRDEKVSFTTDNVTLEEALDLLMLQQNLAYKVYNDHTIIVYPDNQTKQREYEDQVIRTFYLSSADVKDVNALLRGVVDIRKTAVNEGLNAITIRDAQDSIAIAGRLIEANDKAKAELVIDLEILEVNRSKLKSYGLDIRTGMNSGINTSIGFDDDQIRLNNLRRLNQLGSWALSPIPSVVLNLVRNDEDTRVLSRPQVRVTDGEQVTVHLGDQVPIPNTTFNTSQTVGGNIVPITSFTYQDVGIQIQLEPRVHHNREITLKMQAEISSVTSATQGGQPTIGTREIETVIRLRDGESNLLAGLFQETKSNSLSGVPGISDVPILRRIFGQTSRQGQQTEIVLTVTPHIIRVPDIGADDLSPLHVGTQRKTQLRGNTQFGAGGSPFGDREEPPEDLFSDLRPGAESRDPRLLIPDLDLATSLVVEDEDDALAGSGAEQGGSRAPAGAPPASGAGRGGRGETGSPTPPPFGGRGTDAPPAEPGRSGGGGTAAGVGGTEGTVTLALVPARGSVSVGESFDVAVRIDTGGMAVAHAPYHVLFDDSLVDVVNIAEGPFFQGAGADTIWFPNVQPGRILVGHSLLGGRGEPPTGSGTLGIITLRAEAPGRLVLRIDRATPSDATNDALPARAIDAEVSITR